MSAHSYNCTIFFCSLKIDYFVLQYEGFQLGKSFSKTESMTSGSKF